MNLKNELLKVRWRILVYTAWLVLLCKIIFTGEYSNFLRPEFIIVVILGAVALLVFLVSACEAGNEHEHAHTGVLHAAIMLLPFFYYLNAQGESLGGQAYEKRYTGLPAISAGSTSNDLEQLEEQPIALENSEEVDTEPVDNLEIYTIRQEPIDVESGELTILDLYDMPEKFIGKQVAITGMLHKDDEQIAKDFGKNIPIIYRFVITCCVADALPAAILVDTKDYAKFDEGSWVRVKGTFSTVEKEDSMVPTILNSTIENIPVPEQQYMY